MAKVTIYTRDHQTREYELADPKTTYPDGTIWVLGYNQGGKRKWETISSESHAPGCGMTYHLARSIAKIREGELELQRPAAPAPTRINSKPSRVKITDAIDAQQRAVGRGQPRAKDHPG